jgi:Na+/melibiose symporter-like transporter
MENKEKSIALPLIALILSIAPIITFYVAYIVGEVSVPQVLLLTIVGGIMGISSLKEGKKRIGKSGIILAIAAILVAVSPMLIFVAFLTGIIPMP